MVASEEEKERLALEKQALAAQKLALEARVEADRPKTEFHDRVHNQVDAQNINEVGKVLGVGPNKLWKILKEKKVIYKNGRSNVTYQQFIDRGYFRLIQCTYKDGNGEERAYTKTLVTGKGLPWLYARLKEWGEKVVESLPSGDTGPQAA